MKKLLLLLITISSVSTLAQSVKTTKEEQIALFRNNPQLAGSVYRAYPTPEKTELMVPEGYVPTYISHYGRHGSRWLTEDSRYQNLIRVFENNMLSDEGQKVYELILKAWDDARLRSGELTAVGERQHKAIANRMFSNYPTLFSGERTIKAESSIVRRCMMSMMAFCESLKENNPKLSISRSANQRGMEYINFESPRLKEINASDSEWHKTYNTFRRNHIDTISITSRFFSAPSEVKFSQLWFAEELYWLAENIQDTELTDVDLLRFFTPEELFSIWECINLRMYIANSNSPLSMGAPAESSDNLLREITESADNALSGKTNYTANLRFGHDSALLRLLSRMNIEGCSEKISDVNKVSNLWQDYRISPMAANLQLIFYRNNEGNVILRLMLNENPVYLPIASVKGYEGLYEWEAVKNFWK